MPSLVAALFLVLVAFANESKCISVPTGKETPITPAKVTPRPTYHPPAANPAPVVEYNYDNPEPEPLNPSWVPTPVKYLKVLTANSILYVPMRIPNPVQSTYYNIPVRSAAPTHSATEVTTDLSQKETTDQYHEFGAKVTDKQKVKPYYYLPKGQQKQETKSRYPKKAIASPSQKYYYYYPYTNNYQ